MTDSTDEWTAEEQEIRAQLEPARAEYNRARVKYQRLCDRLADIRALRREAKQ